jgi:DNA-binding HxlR family transcriptional regulator
MSTETPRDLAMPDPEATEKDLERERAGSRVLSVFARVLSTRVLRAHADGPLDSSELESRLGWAAKASLRLATRNLGDLGALTRVEPRAGQRGLATELTEAGHDLLSVADALEQWLSRSPFGPLTLADTPARNTIRALVAGWDSAIVGALAVRPRGLSELSAEIGGHSYPALKRRLSRLRSASLVVSLDDRSRSPAQEVTQWLRWAAAPLIAASRWERSHAIGAEAITRHDLESTLLLALPLVELSEADSGACVLAAPASQHADDEAEPALAAVGLVVEEGRIVSCDSGVATTPKTWALGTPDAWLDAIVHGSCDDLRLHGPDADLASALVTGIHRSLFRDDRVER